MVDFRWMSNGGLLIDGSGDIACTSADSKESKIDVVRSRLKAALDGWKLYPIGADLDNLRGQTIDEELEKAIHRQVTRCLSNEFLPEGSFQVETLADIDRIHVFVYIEGQLAASATVSTKGK
jgi:hypothetical protein